MNMSVSTPVLDVIDCKTVMLAICKAYRDLVWLLHGRMVVATRRRRSNYLACFLVVLVGVGNGIKFSSKLKLEIQKAEVLMNETRRWMMEEEEESNYC